MCLKIPYVLHRLVETDRYDTPNLIICRRRIVPSQRQKRPCVAHYLQSYLSVSPLSMQDVSVFDFDALEGGISNRRSVVHIDKSRGTYEDPFITYLLTCFSTTLQTLD